MTGPNTCDICAAPVGNQNPLPGQTVTAYCPVHKPHVTFVRGAVILTWGAGRKTR